MIRLSRRMLIAGACVYPAAVRALSADSLSLVAGTYTKEGGPGLVSLTSSNDGGAWRAAGATPRIANASFGIFSRRFRRWYLLDEQADGRIAAYDAGLKLIGSQPTGGADPCHIALDAGETCLAVANYTGGSIALLPLDPGTGAPLPPQIIAYQGHGPNPDRQEAPHAHWVGFAPGSTWLHVVDLGTDAIHAHRFDPAARRLGEGKVAYQAPAGSGPRHLARHPHLPRAYLVSELANMVTTLDARRDGSFAARATHSTLPEGFAGHSQAAHIAIDRAGRHLYVSNRGHDSIAVFAIDSDGGLKRIQIVSSGGDWPRFFLLLERERRLLVANEHSGTLASFGIGADGRLADSGERLRVPGIVFLGRAAIRS